MQKQHFIVFTLLNGEKMYLSDFVHTGGGIMVSEDSKTFRLIGDSETEVFQTEGKSGESILAEIEAHNAIIREMNDERIENLRRQNAAQKAAKKAKMGFVRFKGDFTIEFKSESPQVNPFIAGFPLLIPALLSYADKKKKESRDETEKPPLFDAKVNT